MHKRMLPRGDEFVAINCASRVCGVATKRKPTSIVRPMLLAQVTVPTERALRTLKSLAELGSSPRG